MNRKFMKKISLYFVLFCLIVFVASCSKTNPLNTKLDNLESIITKYEPQFRSIEYGTQQYSEMIVKYNEEIFRWADDFEKVRYKKNEKGEYVYDEKKSVVMSDDFLEVEKRFYELNNRMTKMVLENIPKPDNKENETDQP